MKKAEWKRRALLAETELRVGPALVFDPLEICWKARTVTYKGRTTTAGPADCLSIPIVSVANALEERGMK